MKLFVILIFSILPLFSEEKFIKTEDGCKISIYENINSTTSPIITEVHGFASSKEEWAKLNSGFDREKMNYISVDLRGHGKSITCNNREISYKDLDANDVKNFYLDIDAVYKYIKKSHKGYQVIPIGASIGANTVMKYFYNRSKKIILMSPSVDYGGIKIEDYVKKTKSKILFTVSETDRYSYSSVQIFKDICAENKIKCNIIISDKGHGVQIFDNDDGQKYIDAIIKWIKN
jgi:alpha-beta hydrolase superfamily lysophospholipase